MNNIATAFAGKKAFIPFITCGDPDLETTKKIIKAMADAGADLIELGIPFSDPTAEGPVIQEANVRALKNGVTTDKVFEMVKSIRNEVSVPLVFMTYANVVFGYGTEKFLQKCKDVGIDGLILPEVPYEEKEVFAPACQKYGISLISLIAPTSDKRIAMIAKDAEGFLYCVSSLGVTGERKEISNAVSQMIAEVRRVNPTIPCAVGFGISTPEQAEKFAREADGVIVGSSIVKLIAKHGKDAVQPVADYVRNMKDAVMKAQAQ